VFAQTGGCCHSSLDRNRCNSDSSKKRWDAPGVSVPFLFLSMLIDRT
jgi:hypothetical protein